MFYRSLPTVTITPFKQHIKYGVKSSWTSLYRHHAFDVLETCLSNSKISHTYNNIYNGRNVSNGNHENGGDDVERDVNVSGKAIESDLDALQAEIRGQTGDLEKCLEQLDQYQQVCTMLT